MSADHLHLDLETRSTVDLRKVGRFVYADHPTTDVWSMAWAFGDEEVQGMQIADRCEITPFVEKTGNPPYQWTSTGHRIALPKCPDRLVAHIENGGLVYAHNAAFELTLWNAVLHKRYGWPKLKLEQMRCTAAMARAMNLPGDLDTLAVALGLSDRKDEAGHRLMMSMCRPRKWDEDLGIPIWWTDAERITRLINYNKQDVVVERAAEKRMRPLSDFEQLVWQTDMRINERGVQIDVEAVKSAAYIAEAELVRINQKIKNLTSGNVNTANQTAKILEHLAAQGLEPENLRKETVEMLLKDPSLDASARELLSLRLEAAKASTKKLNAMLRRVQEDGRARENFIYHGAGTGRWSAIGIQLQNMVRDVPDDMVEIITDICKRSPALLRTLYGASLQVISRCLRGMLISAPGKVLMAADFSNIEGRGLCTLADERWKIDAFAAFDQGDGPDLYKLAYGRSFNKAPDDVEKSERQIGKVMELSLGYQGGVNAFNSMAANYGLRIGEKFEVVWSSTSDLVRTQVEEEFKMQPKETREAMPREERRAWAAANALKIAWRKAHPNTVQYWSDLEFNACEAVMTRQMMQLRDVKFLMSGNVLWLRLPSGRCLAYPDARVQEVATPWGSKKMTVTFMGVDQKTKRWCRQKTYGGLWAENITQAVARDVMVDKMMKLEQLGYPIVMHVHDELVSEVEASTPIDPFMSVMREKVSWLPMLPLAAEGWAKTRYQK